MALSELFAEFLSPFLALLPRVAHRPPTNQWMVVDRWFGSSRQSENPIVYCPSLTHVEYLPKHEVELDCGVQKVTTADWVPLGINATARVKIVDPVLLRYEAGGMGEGDEPAWESIACQICRAFTCSIVQGHNVSQVQDLLCEIDTLELEVDLTSIGLDLVAFKVEDLQQVRIVASVM